MGNQLKAWLQSSQDPTQVANKVKGTILMGSSIVIFTAAHIFHVTISPENIVDLATEIGTLAGAVWAIYGCILHLITTFGTVKSDA